MLRWKSSTRLSQIAHLKKKIFLQFEENLSFENLIPQKAIAGIVKFGFSPTESVEITCHLRRKSSNDKFTSWKFYLDFNRLFSFFNTSVILSFERSRNLPISMNVKLCKRESIIGWLFYSISFSPSVVLERRSKHRRNINTFYCVSHSHSVKVNILWIPFLFLSLLLLDLIL